MCVFQRVLVGCFAGSFVLVSVKSTPVVAAQFDTGFVADFGGADALKSDLESMLHEQDVGPGHYLVGVNINRDFFGQREINFVRRGQHLSACLSTALVSEMGIRLPAQDSEVDEQCLDLKALIEGSTVHFGEMPGAMCHPKNGTVALMQAS
jgi:outer membrane usher protein